jgi:hypothetical protein
MLLLLVFLVARLDRKRPVTMPSSSAIGGPAPQEQTRRPALRLLSGQATAIADAPASCEINGRVISAASGRAIPGAALSLDRGGLIVEASTDGTGQFHFRVEAPATYQLLEVT